MLRMYSKLLQGNIPALSRLLLPSFSKKCIPLSYFINRDVRTLYSSNNLGINGFVLTCEKVRSEYHYKDTFLEKFQKFGADDVLYSEDLRLLISYCQQDKNLVNDVMKFSKVYYNQVKDLHLRPYNFGPVIMRLLHFHNCPDEALKIVLDGEYGTLFHRISAYQLLMDLLYENQRYDDVKIVMEKIILQSLFDIPPSALILVMASNYRIGTDEALEDSLMLFRRAFSAKSRVPLRALGFAAGLALKLHKPQVALEILYKADSPSYFITNNLNLLAQAQLGHINDVLSIIKTMVLKDSSKLSKNQVKPIFCSEVIDKLETIANDTLEMPIIAEMKHLKQVMISMNLIDHETLDKNICQPIEDFRSQEEIDQHLHTKSVTRNNRR